MHYRIFMALNLSLFLLGVGLPAFGAETAEKESVSFSCQPMSEATLAKGVTNFPLTAGKEVSVTCTSALLQAGDAVPVALLGKQTSDTSTPAVSMTSMVLSTAPAAATFSFPAVYRPGTYRYSFSIIDVKTQMPLGKEVVMEGILKGKEKAYIQAVLTDKDRYEWQDPLTLQVAFVLPDGSEPATSRVAILNREGRNCVILSDNRPVTRSDETMALALPEETDCSATLAVTLSDQEGNVLDQKQVALGLPPMKEKKISGNENGIFKAYPVFGSMPKIFLGGLVVTALLIVSLIGYFILRSRRPRAF